MWAGYARKRKERTVTTMTKHTPGPWSIEKRLNGHGGFRVGPANVSAHMYGTDRSWDEEWGRPENAQSVADAHLIAAAPELLGALIKLYNNPDDAGVRAYAVQTMRKAEGR